MKTNTSLGLLVLRFFISLRLLYGVTDNIVSWARMKEFEAFLAQLHFPLPLLSANVSVYLQAVCGICILAGYLVRMASMLMVLNFAVAVLVHVKMDDTIEGITPALAMLSGCLCLFFTGAGRYAIDKSGRGL